MKTKIYLHGELATVVGRSEWLFSISSPAEALQAIEVTSNGKLLDYLYKDVLAAYRVVVDGEDTSAAELGLERPIKEIHIIPVLHGSANDAGMWMTIIGIVLIAASFLIPGLGALAPMFFMAGVTLTLSGVAQMLAPDPEDGSEKPENMPSYLFNGPVNTYRQGNPVPCGFGALRVGSQVLSAGVVNMKTAGLTDRFELDFREDLGNTSEVNLSKDIPAAALANQNEYAIPVTQVRLSTLLDAANVDL